MTKNTTNDGSQPTANAVGPGKGVRILKHGMLAQAATVPITGIPTLDQYGKMAVPLELDGQKFIHPVSLKNPEWNALVAAFGDPSPAWVGCRVLLQDGKVLKQVSIKPIADAKGRVVATDNAQQNATR